MWASSVLDFEFDLDFDMDEPEIRRDCSFLALDILILVMLLNRGNYSEPAKQKCGMMLVFHFCAFLLCSCNCSTPAKKWKRELAKAPVSQ